MPVKKEREYRTLVTPLTAQVASDKRINTECYVEGYATTFNVPYLLYEFEDGTKIYERIDAHALDNADMSDVIMQYDHTGRVFARQSNKTLILEPDAKGLFVAADLSMGEDKKADKKRKRIVPKAPVQMIISREYVGTQTVTEAFIPIISEDIRKKIAEGDTFDNEGLSA